MATGFSQHSLYAPLRKALCPDWPKPCGENREYIAGFSVWEVVVRDRVYGRADQPHKKQGWRCRYDGPAVAQCTNFTQTARTWAALMVDLGLRVHGRLAQLVVPGHAVEGVLPPKHAAPGHRPRCHQLRQLSHLFTNRREEKSR